MENEDSDIIGSGPPTASSSSQRRQAPLTRFGSLSFMNDYRLASEMLAGNEKLLKQAFFNAAANIFVLLAILASIAVFYVLELFLRPLLWATLTGSFLYPFKKAATGCVQNWLNCLSDSRTPLFIGLLLLPFNTVNYLADRIGHFVSKKFYLFLAIIFAYPLLYIIFTYTPIKFLFYALCSLVNLLCTLHGYFTKFWMRAIAPYFWTILIAYCIFVLFYARKENHESFKKASLVAWSLMSYHLFLTSSSLVLVVLTVVSLVMLIGYFLKMMGKIDRKQKLTTEGQPTTFAATSKPPMTTQLSDEQKDGDTTPSLPTVNSDEATEDESCETTSVFSSSGGQIAQLASFLKCCGQQIFNADSVKRKSSSKRDTRSAKSTVDQKVESNFNDVVVSYGFYSLGWAIVTIQALKHLWILPSLLLPLTIFILKRGFVVLGVDQIVSPYFKTAKDKLVEVEDVLMPAGIHKLIQYYLEGDRKVIKALQGSIGIVVSVLLVLLLLLGCLIMSFFLAAQIQQEAMAVVEMGTTLAQEMTASYPQFKSIMPNNTDIQSSLTLVVERAYDYSRDLIEKWITTYLVVEQGEQASQKSQQITDQLLAIYDQLYLQLWLKRNETSNQTMAEVLSSVKSLYSSESDDSGSPSGSSGSALPLVSSDGLMKAIQTHGADWFYSGYDVIHGNFDTLRSVAISVWAILRSNLSLIANVVTSLIWVILSSGSHIMNFSISIVVFLTALFYLLSLSGNRYKPMEIIASIMPSTSDGSNSKSLPPQNRFAEAVNSAVMGVFGASLKLSSFYGLLTYVTHTIAGVRLVFLPAAVAAILGAVPVFGTYLACLPAFLELWLLHDQLLGAFLLLLAHLLPTYGGFDTAIYGQISGAGHPYLTGLAVVGGISIKGLEGAILGPLLLCLLIVVSNMYTTMIAGETDSASSFANSFNPDRAHFSQTSSSKRRPPELRAMRSRSMVGVENLDPYLESIDQTPDVTL